MERYLKNSNYSILMNKRDLEKLSKEELIELLLNKENKPKVTIVDTKPKRSTQRKKQKVVDDRPGYYKNPATNRWIRIGSKTYKRLFPTNKILNPATNRYINIGGRTYQRVFPDIHRQNVALARNIRKLTKVQFNFDDDIFQTENTSIGKFKIISIQSRENKKFKSSTNEFKVKILKKLDDNKDIYHIFQEIVKTVKKRRNLSYNDMLRIVIQNEELPKAISTKFNKVENFKLGDLDTIINILEYRAIPIENCKIVVQSVKIPAGKGRLYLTKIPFQERTVSLQLRTTIPFVYQDL